MNLIGKIFIVIIVVMAVLFMGLSMAVYSAHKNWPEEVKKTREELTKVEADLEREKSTYQRVEAQLRSELETSVQQVRKLEQERDDLQTRNEEIQTEVNGLRTQQAEAIAAVASTQANNEQLANDNTKLQAEILTARQARDLAFDKVVATTELLHDASIKLAVSLETNRQLLDELTPWVQAAKNAGLDPNKDMPAPLIDGFVSAVRKRPGVTAIEITIGADDGIKQGHTIEVFQVQGQKYVGRARIKKTGPDRAVAEMIPDMQVRQVQEGDRVTTRLKLT